MSPSRSITPTSLPMISTEPTGSLRMFATRTPRSFRFTAEELYCVSRAAIRICREKDVCSNDPVDLRFVRHSRSARRTAEIHRDHRLIDKRQSANSQFTRYRHIVECAVDLDTCGQT